MKVRRLRSGCIASPPGPRQSTGVPAAASFFLPSPLCTPCAGRARARVSKNAQANDRRTLTLKDMSSLLMLVALPPRLFRVAGRRGASQARELVNALAQRADVAFRHRLYVTGGAEGRAELLVGQLRE